MVAISNQQLCTNVYALGLHSAQSLLLFQTCRQSVTLATVYLCMVKKFAVLYLYYIRAGCAVKHSTHVERVYFHGSSQVAAPTSPADEVANCL